MTVLVERWASISFSSFVSDGPVAGNFAARKWIKICSSHTFRIKYHDYGTRHFLNVLADPIDASPGVQHHVIHG